MTDEERYLRNLVIEYLGVYDPIVSHPGGWETPQGVIRAIIEERFEHFSDENVTATNSEASAYLSTASLCGPLDHDWAEIFMVVSGQMMLRMRHL